MTGRPALADGLLRRSPHVVWRRLADRAVLAPAHADSEPVVLNQTGALVWDLLDEPRTLDQLARDLADRHAATPDVIRADLVPLLDDLVERGLVER